MSYYRPIKVIRIPTGSVGEEKYINRIYDGNIIRPEKISYYYDEGNPHIETAKLIDNDPTVVNYMQLSKLGVLNK